MSLFCSLDCEPDTNLEAVYMKQTKARTQQVERQSERFHVIT